MMKTAVIYFSATGTTEKAARKLADAAGADLFRIEPETPYTSADLNWTDSSSRTTQEKNDPSIRPAIKGDVKNFDQYDTIFLGFPIWWYTSPAIISTFVESHDFTGKTVIPFCTSGGSSIGNIAEKLKKEAGTGTWKQGGRLTSSQSEDSLSSWVKAQGK